MAALYRKVISGKPYWYLREMARVDGKPKMVSERYLGSAADIEALLDAQETATLPARTRHLGFGDVAAAWEVLDRLDVIGLIDGVLGARRADAQASVGTYLTLAALNRLVEPRSKLGFAAWWKTTAADRFTRIRATALDHRRFWDAMHTITLEQLAQIEQQLAVRMIETFNLDISALALDMTNFATYIDTTNDKARNAVLAAETGAPEPAEMTVVFDAGQNSVANFAHLIDAGLAFVGSIPPSDVLDLLALPASARTLVDADRFAGLGALETRRVVYGVERRVVLTHSPTLHAAQQLGFAQTLAKALGKLTDLAETLARGKTRRSAAKVTAEINAITHDPWLRRVLLTELTGTTPAAHRLSVKVDQKAQDALEAEVFGKRILVTNRDDWPIAEVVGAYRSQSDAEFSFRQLKDPHVVSFSPMHHWTEHNIRVHTFTCVLALQIAHLMRREAEHAGLHLSVRE